MGEWNGPAGRPGGWHPEPGTGDRLVGADLTTRLERWAAEARVDDAARQRERERWLRQQAEEDGTLSGVLTDLAEHGTAVSVHTRGGRERPGQLRAVGDDFVAMASTFGEQVLLALAGIASVRTLPGHRPATGDRAVRTGLRLAEVLVGLAAERERALLVSLDGSHTVAGRVRAVGRDLVVVRLDGDDPPTAYLPLDAVGEVVVGAG